MNDDLFARVRALIPDRYTVTTYRHGDYWVIDAVPNDGGTRTSMDFHVDEPDDMVVAMVAGWIGDPFPGVFRERYGMW